MLTSNYSRAVKRIAWAACLFEDADEAGYEVLVGLGVPGHDLLQSA